jgi:hypothetical protein
MSDFMSNVESVVNSIYCTGLVYSLVAYYWITWVCESGYILAHKTVRGAINAHRGQEFVFLSRNSCPWQRYVQDEELGILRIQYPLVYNVNDCHFEFPMNPMNNEGRRSFSTVVTVDLVNSDETISFVLSSFFHELSWDAGEYSPSLFEIVLTYLLENDLLFTLDKISGFRLKVFTNDGEDRIIHLDSDFALSDFEGWYENASPAPSATSEMEDSLAVVSDSYAVVPDSYAVVEDSHEVVPEVVADVVAELVDELMDELVDELMAEVSDSATDDRPHLETPPSASASASASESSDAFEA